MRTKFAAAQIDVMPNSTDNISKVERIAKDANKQNVDLVVFPEYFIVHPDQVNKGKKNYDRMLQKIQFFAVEYGLCIVGAHPEVQGEELYNTAFFISDNGDVVGKHRKMFLCFTEPEIFNSGKEVKAFNTKFGKTGLLVCFDSFGFPHSTENMKKLKQQGTELLLVPIFSLKTDPLSLEWIRSPLITHSLWNNFSLIATSNIGDAGVVKGKRYRALGHSLIVCPKKGLIREGSEDKEEFLIADLSDTF
jgi:predicted amidohydrolase